MKITKKVILALMIFSIFVFVFSCKSPEADRTDNNNDNTDNNEVLSSANEVTEPEITESNAMIIKERFKELNYNGLEIKILSPQPGANFYGFSSTLENELWYEGETGSVLNDAVYYRNLMTEELLGIKIVPVFVADTNAVTTTVNKLYQAGDNSAYDIVINRLDYIANLAQNGRFKNLCGIETMDVENSWWDKEIVDNFRISRDKLYFIAGDINYYDDYGVQIMFYNEKLYKDQGGSYNLYQLVRDGKWTFDIMAELIKNSSQDLDGDGTLTFRKDLFGFADNQEVVHHFIYSFNQRLSQIENGEIKLMLNSSELIDTVDFFSNYFRGNPAVDINTYDGSSAFKEGNLLFFTDMLGILPNFVVMEDDFGILPMPKKNEQAERYTAYVSNGWATAYAIPSISEEPGKMGAVLETMSAFSTDTVTKSIKDTMLQLRWVRNEDSADMLQYIYDSKIYDWANDLTWAADARTAVNGSVNSAANTFVSKVESILARTQTKLDAMIAGYDELD